MIDLDHGPTGRMVVIRAKGSTSFRRSSGKPAQPVSAILVKEMRTALALLVVLMIAGCESQEPRPNFLARSLHDCANGDQSACAMLGSLSAVSTKVNETKIEQRPRTQAEKDADAIMDGVHRARSSPPVQNLRMAPAIKRDS